MAEEVSASASPVLRARSGPRAGTSGAVIAASRPRCSRASRSRPGSRGTALGRELVRALPPGPVPTEHDERIVREYQHHDARPRRIDRRRRRRGARGGVVRLRRGRGSSTRIEAAGGATPDADLTRLNLAAPLVDGSRIAVPRVGAPGARGRSRGGERRGCAGGRAVAPSTDAPVESQHRDRGPTRHAARRRSRHRRRDHPRPRRARSVPVGQRPRSGARHRRRQARTAARPRDGLTWSLGPIVALGGVDRGHPRGGARRESRPANGALVVGAGALGAAWFTRSPRRSRVGRGRVRAARVSRSWAAPSTGRRTRRSEPRSIAARTTTVRGEATEDPDGPTYEASVLVRGRRRSRRAPHAARARDRRRRRRAAGDRGR